MHQKMFKMSLNFFLELLKPTLKSQKRRNPVELWNAATNCQHMIKSINNGFVIQFYCQTFAEKTRTEVATKALKELFGISFGENSSKVLKNLEKARIEATKIYYNRAKGK